MHGKVVIVTGGNTGIGKETARGLAGLGATVIIACRDPAKGESARAGIAASTGRGDVTFLPLDLADVASIRSFAATFSERFARLDVLVNNAGVSMPRRATTRDGFETVFGVNHLGTFLLTRVLLDVLRRSAPSRIVVVSSRLHARAKMPWDDLQSERGLYNGFAAYNQSKLANVLFTKALARRLEGTGVTVNALHPGVVATNLLRQLPAIVRWVAHRFMVTPAEGAACSIYVASSPEVASTTGEYFDACKPAKVGRAAHDVEAQERLWKVSESLLRL